MKLRKDDNTISKKIEKGEYGRQYKILSAT